MTKISPHHAVKLSTLEAAHQEMLTTLSLVNVDKIGLAPK